MQNISLGGSNSRQWLHPDKFPYRKSGGQRSQAQFDRILQAKPDLVTIEFVNDAGLSPAMVEQTYSEILERLKPLAAR